MVSTVGLVAGSQMFVTFNSEHREKAEAAADRAQQRVREMNLNNSALYQRTDRMDDWAADYLGALAELAVADYSELPWGNYELGGVDVGDDIEVRRTGQYWGGLRVMRKDYDDVRINVNVLVYMENDVHALLVGWVNTETAWIRGRQCAEKRPGCCRYYRESDSLIINRKHLRPIDQLPERTS
jgi:hypothetical protein